MAARGPQGWAEWQEVSRALNTNFASAQPYPMSPTLKKARRPQQQILTDFFSYISIYSLNLSYVPMKLQSNT